MPTALAIVTLGLVAAAAAAPPAVTVHYALTPNVVRDTLRSLRVEVRFTGDADGETVLRLPDAWGGESHLWRVIRGLEAAGATVEAGADSAHRVLRHAPGAQITVRYDVVQDRPGVPVPDGRNTYRPVVQPGYFHVIGNAVFAAPERDTDMPARFAWGPGPAGWRFASDLEHVRADRPLRLGDVLESVAVGGDYRVIVRPHAGGDLRVAIRGAWSFTDDSLADRIDRIVTSHRRFWGDPDEPFLVTVLPLGADSTRSSLGGTGLSDAFAFFATDNAQESTLNRLLAHEHLHTWIPRRVGRMRDSSEAADYWLSEGFTDFFTFRLLVRDGLWSLDDYVSATNEVLLRYAQSPLRTAPNERIVRDFWTDSNAQELPYQRGFLLATMWDERLRRASKGRAGLGDVLMAMKKAYAARAPGVRPPLVTDAFVRAARDAGFDLGTDLETYVEGGAAILLAPGVLGEGATVATESVAEFTRGFDPEATRAAGNVVKGCDPNGPAWAAGLRDGMKILERQAGRIGDSRVDLVYRVRDGEHERLVRYRPAGTRHYSLQSVRLDPAATAATRARLVRRIGGE